MFVLLWCIFLQLELVQSEKKKWPLMWEEAFLLGRALHHLVLPYPPLEIIYTTPHWVQATFPSLLDQGRLDVIVEQLFEFSNAQLGFLGLTLLPILMERESSIFILMTVKLKSYLECQFICFSFLFFC